MKIFFVFTLFVTQTVLGYLTANTIQLVFDKSCFTLQTTRTSDLGKYKVVATNEFGEVTYPFSVKIEKVASTGSVPNFKTYLKHR